MRPASTSRYSGDHADPESDAAEAFCQPLRLVRAVFLDARFAGYDDKPEDRAKVAADVAAEQIEDLRRRGIHDIHLYTMNRSALVSAVLEKVGKVKVKRAQAGLRPELCLVRMGRSSLTARSMFKTVSADYPGLLPRTAPKQRFAQMKSIDATKTNAALTRRTLKECVRSMIASLR